MSSRNAREGRYCGRAAGRHLRGRGRLPELALPQGEVAALLVADRVERAAYREWVRNRRASW